MRVYTVRVLVLPAKERAGVDWYEQEVRAIERAHALRPPPAGGTLFYGSSSLRLWATLADDMAPHPVVNRAFGGSTMAACAHFFERLVLPCAPGALVVYAGDNDLGDGRRPDEVIRSLDALVERADRWMATVPMAFIAIKPSPARWALREQVAQVNAAARQRLAARPHGLYVDIVGPMLGADGRPRPELFVADGLHLSAAGYALWAPILRAALDRMRAESA